MAAQPEQIPKQEPGARTEKPIAVSLDATVEELSDIVDRVGDADGADLLIRRSQLEGATADVQAEVRPSGFRAEHALGTTEARDLQEKIAALDAQMEAAGADFKRLAELAMEKAGLEGQLTTMVKEHADAIAEVEGHDPQVDRIMHEAAGEVERAGEDASAAADIEGSRIRFDALVNDVSTERRTTKEIEAAIALKKEKERIDRIVDEAGGAEPDNAMMEDFARNTVGPINAEERQRADAKKYKGDPDPFAAFDTDMGTMMADVLSGKQPVIAEDDPFKW